MTTTSIEMSTVAPSTGRTCSCVCCETSRPLMYSTWSPSFSRGIHRSAGVWGATLDTMIGMPWSAPPWNEHVWCGQIRQYPAGSTEARSNIIITVSCYKTLTDKIELKRLLSNMTCSRWQLYLDAFGSSSLHVQPLLIRQLVISYIHTAHIHPVSN